MPAANKMTIAALLAISVSLAGCNSSKKSSSSDTAAATTAAASAASDSGAVVGASAPAAPAAAAATGPAGCALTAAQVSSVMGTTYGDPQNFNGICNYASSSDSLSIHVMDATGINNFDATLATIKQDQGSDTTTTISGVGDKAAGTELEIAVQSGSKVIDIRNADNAPWPKSIALAKLVIAGLK
ncbi:MAG TPA: hypothetical protein VFG00_14375 [Acidothermaceae bacterium]|nr:hypothetical protein [Acidothermaceae bacterium]